ncbi:Golgi vesicular membrane trafficking protein, putative [Bodo saltans]|uniref:Golgi vesicular membrane trafficking protein, putative n=1 Tax=Bodo saltans TaxID=75058 RepID=A0A0S4JHY8_BODSA|nr:Golgi vesicular membrane trafficking protein, putative [Bodo saltans]|eukprot:CUG88657.1 Golgi vesicular membrane trafficking protein, putative [Bodo saltans]
MSNGAHRTAARSTLFQRAGRNDLASPNSPHSADMMAAMEDENEEAFKGLRDDIRRLRGVSDDLGKEIAHHNSILDALEVSLGSAKVGLTKTMRKLDEVTGTSGMGHIWLLLLFAFGVFFFIFLLLKFR